MRVTNATVSTRDGAALAVSEWGSGPSLLLIPGLGATRAVFDPLVPYLSEKYHVLTYDPRGVGESSPGSDAMTLPVFARDAADVVAARAGGQAAVLGASMGGVVAQQLALDHEPMLEALVLAATSPGGSKAVPPDPRATAALLGRGARTPADAYRRATTVLYAPQFARAHPEFIEQQIRVRADHPVRAQVFTAQLQAMRDGADMIDRLGSLQVPTLVMHGTADAVTPFENARALAARIPGARTRWFADGGHLFFHERPQEAARVVDEFLRDVRGAVSLRR